MRRCHRPLPTLGSFPHAPSNVGLPIFECPEASKAIAEGDTLEVDTSSGTITMTGSGEIFHFSPFPPFIEEIVAAGGLVPFVREELERRKTR